MSKKRILIVEDNIISSMALEMMITGAGFESAGRLISADSLMETFDDYSADLIMLDIMLDGEKTGIEVAQEIREKYDTPIVFTTALNDVETRESIKKIDNSVLASKPYIEDGILYAIEQLLPPD